MSLVVEDGTGLANAESYISVANADAYFTARGNATWAAITTTALKEEALRRATDYMVQVYRQRWQGYRMTDTQALDWPRSGVVVDAYRYVDTDEVPTEVAHACAELAVRASAGELVSDLSRVARRVKVDVIETEYEPGSLHKSYPAVSRLLAPFLKSAGGATLVRA